MFGGKTKMRLASRPAPPCCAPAPAPPSCIAIAMRSMQPFFPLRISQTVCNPQAKFIRMKSTSKKRTPSIVNLTVKRHYLTEREVERLMNCPRKHGHYEHRHATMILVDYRPGLRATEVCELQCQQIEL